MKKLILLMFLLPVCLMGRAQGWYVGAEASRYLGDEPQYWQAAVTGSYTKAFSQFISLDANASLYYQNYNHATETLLGGGFSSSNAQTFGGSLGINGILKINGPVSLFTGPRLNCNFYQSDFHDGDPDGDFGFHRAMAEWRVGLSVDVWKLRVRASWDIMMTSRNDYGKKGSAITVGIAYNL